MKSITENLNTIKKELNPNVKLIAVSKTQAIESIIEAYNCGQYDFGENKVQELSAKYEQLKNLNIKWHFIGHLQTNKVKYIINFIDTIHSVDSFKLLTEIDRLSKQNNISTNCLLQFHIAKEDSKYGLTLADAENILNSDKFKNLKNISICGVMGMATYTDDISIIRSEFRNLKNIFDKLKANYFSTNNTFCEISMGMSNDYKIAIEEGSTMLRMGTTIFGMRNYNK